MERVPANNNQSQDHDNNRGSIPTRCGIPLLVRTAGPAHAALGNDHGAWEHAAEDECPEEACDLQRLQEDGQAGGYLLEEAKIGGWR